MASFVDIKKQREARHAQQASGTARQPAYGTAGSSVTARTLDDDAGQLADEVARINIGVSVEGSTSALQAQPSEYAATENARYPQVAWAGLEVRTTPTRGRGIYATRRVVAGTTLVSHLPTVAALTGRHLRTHCSHCYRPLVKAMRCAACRTMHYCSGACQRADWPAHKPECRAFNVFAQMSSRAHPDRPPAQARLVSEGVRAMARLCWARRDARAKTGNDPEWWEGIRDMESHRTSLPQAELERLKNGMSFLKHLLSAADGGSAGGDVIEPADMRDYGFATEDEFIDFGSAFAVNSFTLSKSELSPVGVATSPLLALVNHSCAPNAVVVFPSGPDMRLVVIADLDAGDEVLTSYVDVSDPYHVRQEALLERYGFKCDCTLCAAFTPTSIDPMWCVMHEECGGRARMPKLEGERAERVCENGHRFTVDTLVLNKLHSTGMSMIIEEERGILDEAEAKQILSKLVPKLLHMVSPSHSTLLALLRLRALVHASADTPADLAVARRSIVAAGEGARIAYPPNHPALGVLLAERAKLFALDDSGSGLDVGLADPDSSPGRACPIVRKIPVAQAAKMRTQLAVAIAATREAIGVLRIGFGAGGDAEKDMQELLQGMEQEMASLRGV
ncbi:hypothetical protein Q5752_001602 [Cryptotrichosporon argae]